MFWLFSPSYGMLACADDSSVNLDMSLDRAKRYGKIRSMFYDKSHKRPDSG